MGPAPSGRSCRGGAPPSCHSFFPSFHAQSDKLRRLIPPRLWPRSVEFKCGSHGNIGSESKPTLCQLSKAAFLRTLMLHITRSPACLSWNGSCIRAGSRFHNGLFMDQVRATADVFSCLFTSPAWIPHFRFITVLAPAVFPT